MDDGREDQNPWTKWYWQDWKTDDGLQLCSLAAQGLWMHMLCTMAKAKRYGYLLIGNKKILLSELALLARISEEETEKLVEELRSKDVFSETDRGVIFCRRMVRQAELSEIRSKAGKQGGRPKAKQKQNESKLKAKHKHDVKAPSASASASEYASASSSNKNLITEIICYLNEKAGKNFSEKSENTINLISGRLSEGRTIEDFKKVIDTKVKKWKGDPKMDDYLRPDTLFRPSNFESYLNEKMPPIPAGVNIHKKSQKDIEWEKVQAEYLKKHPNREGLAEFSRQWHGEGT